MEHFTKASRFQYIEILLVFVGENFIQVYSAGMVNFSSEADSDLWFDS